MCALRLECFTDDTPQSSKTISLFEGFESEKDIAFSRGVKSGAEAASKAFEAEKIRSLYPILEALNDAGFSQTAARQAALESLQPLLRVMIDTVLPASASAGFTSEVVARVLTAVERQPDANITVTVPSDSVASIEQMLSPAQANCQVVGDPSMSALEARVKWDSGFDSLNLIAVIDDVDAVTREFFSHQDSNIIAGGRHA
ncbi:MAG: hypothetical protein JKY31_09365 [Rhodobacteraceae bacterium]|nr:hypothetical protein [Paracoccaceae bacterium]